MDHPAGPERGPTAADDPDAAGAEAPRLLQELHVLHKAAARLHQLRDPEVLARDIITILGEVTPHDFAAVYVIDEDRLQTFAVSDRGLGSATLAADKDYLDSLDLHVGENVTGWVAAHGEPVLLRDVRADPRYLDSQLGVLSELCVPMRLEGRVIGVVNLEACALGAYDAEDQRLLEILCSQIAIAIDNARLLERTREFERLRVLAELTGGVAHDLGNLLQVTVGHLDLLLDGQHGAQGNQAAGIDMAMQKAITLTRGLLRIGRPRTASTPTIDLAATVRAAGPLLDVLCGPDLGVVLQTPSTTCPVEADAAAIEQVLMNLVVNARQATANGGTITASVQRLGSPEGGTVELAVADTGRGMDATARTRALEPYFTTRADGTGLGLSTVARITEELGGTLDIASTLEVGTTVTLQLPLAVAASHLADVPGA